MKDMEIEMYLEKLGYEEYEIEEMMEDYLPKLREHIGFEDNRIDKRFIVKFHDIVFTQDNEEDEELFWELFNDFCNQMYENTLDEMKEFDADESDILSNTRCGNYRTFMIDIPEITEDNIIDLLTEIYDNSQYPSYIEKHIKTVELLKDMEENYVKWWNDFVDEPEWEKFKVNVKH